MTKGLFILLFVVIYAIIAFLIVHFASKAEAKAWNGGICPHCGKPLRHFDDDSQGGHGWCCDDCDYTTWVSYHKLVYRTKKEAEELKD